MEVERERKAMGGRLRQWRRQNAISAVDLAERVGLHANTLYKIEQGLQASMPLLFRLGERTGIDLHWLITGQHRDGGKKLKVVRDPGHSPLAPARERGNEHNED